MINNRGQIAGQMFVYISGIIIIGMIIFFGLRIFNNASKISEKYVSNEFQNKIKSDVNSLIDASGSYNTNKYILPKGFDEICFINPSSFEKYSTKIGDLPNYPMIQDSISSGSNNNVFLFSSKSFGAFYINNLELIDPPYFACSSAIRGVVSVKFISFGDMVSIKASAYKKYCENAANADINGNDLCAGLDIAFGAGYREDCQTKYGLC